MTAKQYLKLHPEKYVLTSNEHGSPLYVAPSTDLHRVDLTTEINKAEQWDSLSNTPTKLGYYRYKTGLKNLEFIQVN